MLVGALDAGAGPEIVTWPMLLAGLGIGALASQLGAVTVSAVPDEQSGEVGGLQNTVTNLGASIGTALAGAVLDRRRSPPRSSPASRTIPTSPTRCRRRRQVELAAASRSSPTPSSRRRSTDAGVPPATADAIVDENADARLDALRDALAVLALIALAALLFTRRIPMRQAGRDPTPAPA